ncbi:hypothetical protein [Actinoplanes aureus]|uniref:Uncharacterized protein n=1 Tax=Actinoplanes aureus TaxID=2792083 RepID=A0A931C913_9ACTN|nr:hypothetical protein [Actinoplanes aureus]MBG0565674.1 hypothetical protein [Actinoplanes aureus]
MAGFIDLVSDDRAARRLARAINGRGAFHRFENELNEEYPHLARACLMAERARALARWVLRPGRPVTATAPWWRSPCWTPSLTSST